MPDVRHHVMIAGLLMWSAAASALQAQTVSTDAPLAAAVAGQQRILDELNAILQEEKATLSDAAVQSALQALLEDERAQAESIRTLGRRTLGRPAAELTDQDRAEQAAIAGRQDALRDRYGRLETTLKAKSGGKNGETFGRFLAIAEEGRLAEQMSSAAQLIGENQLGRALQTTNAIIAVLEQMLVAAGQKVGGNANKGGGTPPGMMLPSLWLKGEGADLPFFARGGDTVDTLGQILAMLRQLEELARRQREIAERLAAGPADDADAIAGQEDDIRGQALTIGERLALLDPQMNALLMEAGASLGLTSERLRSGGAGAVTPAAQAAEQLVAATQRLQALWKDILARIKQFTQETAPLVGGGSGTPHGLSAAMKKLYERLTLMMLRATGALAEDIRRETALREQTVATRPAGELPGLGGEQEAIAAHVQKEVLPFNVSLDDLPEHLHTAPLRNPVPAAELLARAAEFMDTAAGKLRASDGPGAAAAESQAIAAMDEALLAMVDILQRLLGQLSPPGATPNGGAGLGMAMDPGGGEPGTTGWQADLLPTQREAVRQAFRGNFPQRYDKAIKRYYETIAREQP